MANDNQQQGGGSHGGHRPNAGRKKLSGQVFRVRITNKQLLDKLEDHSEPCECIRMLIDIGFRETDGMSDY